MEDYEQRGIPGCKGSIDGMHRAWKNCPDGWAGEFEGKEKSLTIVLEAVTSKNLHIWHAFVHNPGTLHDINVLNWSTIFDNYIKSKALSTYHICLIDSHASHLSGVEPHVYFTVNGHKYNQPYYLADETYPIWPVLIKTFQHAQDDMGKHFSMLQEAAQKDIKQAFGVLQLQWAILAMSCWVWDLTEVKWLMTACIILHNMIVEEQHPLDPNLNNVTTIVTPTVQDNHHDPAIHNTFHTIHQNHINLHQEVIHHQLTKDLKIYNWMQHGANIWGGKRNGMIGEEKNNCLIKPKKL